MCACPDAVLSRPLCAAVERYSARVDSKIRHWTRCLLCDPHWDVHCLYRALSPKRLGKRGRPSIPTPTEDFNVKRIHPALVLALIEAEVVVSP